MTSALRAGHEGGGRPSPRRRSRRLQARLGWEEYATRWEDVVRPQGHRYRRHLHTRRFAHAHRHRCRASEEAILCEKPLANTLGEAEKMWKPSERPASSTCSATTTGRPGGDAGQAAHRRRKAREDPSLSRHLPAGLAGRSRVPALVAAVKRRRPAPERWETSLSHTLDLSRFLVGEPVEVKRPAGRRSSQSVHCSTIREERRTVDVDDAALSFVRFDNGAIGTSRAPASRTGRKNYNRFEINGAKAAWSSTSSG